ncbi:hypothetical protein ACJX0J_006366 [Zea mays]
MFVYAELYNLDIANFVLVKQDILGGKDGRRILFWMGLILWSTFKNFGLEYSINTLKIVDEFMLICTRFQETCLCFSLPSYLYNINYLYTYQLLHDYLALGMFIWACGTQQIQLVGKLDDMWHVAVCVWHVMYCTLFFRILLMMTESKNYLGNISTFFSN